MTFTEPSMRQCANAIVDELYDDLKSKVISAIGNDQIVPKCLCRDRQVRLDE